MSNLLGVGSFTLSNVKHHNTFKSTIRNKIMSEVPPVNKTERYETLEPLSPVFKDERQVRNIAKRFGTPVYVYSRVILGENVRNILEFPNAFGLTVRYAIKSNPNANLLRMFHNAGLHFDASSEYEAERARRAGIPNSKIMVTSQDIPSDLSNTLKYGEIYNACSLWQLENFGQQFRGQQLSVRINPGLGSGGTNRTNTGGPASSFGIWHEDIGRLLDIASDYNLTINLIHTHIGSGSDPEVWKRVALMSLDTVKMFLDAGHPVRTLNMGGGYKVGRMLGEKSTNLQECGGVVRDAFIDFKNRTDVQLKLEIEPGTYMVANAGAVISRVVDVKSTPKYNFIIIDSGMTEVTRPVLYGAQHPITVVQMNPTAQVKDYIVSGKCCESGDILTPAPGDSEGLRTRVLAKASRGDLVVIGGAGAYCSGMSTKNYNSHPEAPEVLLDIDDRPYLIRVRQSLDQIIENETIRF